MLTVGRKLGWQSTASVNSQCTALNPRNKTSEMRFMETQPVSTKTTSMLLYSGCAAAQGPLAHLYIYMNGALVLKILPFALAFPAEAKLNMQGCTRRAKPLNTPTNSRSNEKPGFYTPVRRKRHLGITRQVHLHRTVEEADGDLKI